MNNIFYKSRPNIYKLMENALKNVQKDTCIQIRSTTKLRKNILNTKNYIYDIMLLNKIRRLETVNFCRTNLILLFKNFNYLYVT